MKLRRIRGRKINDRLRRTGNVWMGKTFTVRWLPDPPLGEDKDGLYFGSFASVKLHKSAVKRNRMRRRCREAVRRAVREMKSVPTAQMLLSPRKTSVDCSFEEITNDVHSFLNSLQN